MNNTGFYVVFLFTSVSQIENFTVKYCTFCISNNMACDHSCSSLPVFLLHKLEEAFDAACYN
jgi:hypothetical protein